MWLFLNVRFADFAVNFFFFVRFYFRVIEFVVSLANYAIFIALFLLQMPNAFGFLQLLYFILLWLFYFVFFRFFVDSFQFQKRLTLKFVVRLFRLFFIFIFVSALKIKSIAFWLEFCLAFYIYSVLHIYIYIVGM